MLKYLIVIFFLFAQTTCFAQGKFQWVKNPTSTDHERGHDVYEDHSGNVYSVGSYTDSLNFAGQLLYTPKEEGLILKYDGFGNELWVRKIGSSDENYCHKITGDTLGNIYILGVFHDTARFGTFVLKSNYYDGFLCKLDSNGNFLWVFHMKGSTSSFVSPLDLKVDESGNSYIIGTYYHFLNFGTIYLNGFAASDIFTGKVNSNGLAVWARRAGSNGSVFDVDRGYGIAIDSRRNCYVTGGFKDTAIFGTIALISQGKEDIFIAKYDSIGNVLWANRAGNLGFEDESGIAIAVVNDNSIYAIGVANYGTTFGGLNFQTKYSRATFITELDSNGSFIRVASVANTIPPGWLRGKQLFVSQNGESFLTVSSQSYDPIGSYLAYGSVIVKLDSLFNVAWVKPFKDIGGIYYNQQSLFYCGNIWGTFSVDQYSLTSNRYDIFTGKLNDASNRISGRVFEDIDGDTIFSVVDIPYLNDSIYLDFYHQYLVSDSSGNWQATIDTGALNLINTIPVGYIQVKPIPNIYTPNFFNQQMSMAGLDFVLSKITGSNETLNKDVYNVYPNPFEDDITFSGSKSNGFIELFDLMGKVVFYQYTFGEESKLNLENVNPGLYLLRYFEGSKTVNFKVIKH